MFGDVANISEDKYINDPEKKIKLLWKQKHLMKNIPNPQCRRTTRIVE